MALITRGCGGGYGRAARHRPPGPGERVGGVGGQRDEAAATQDLGGLTDQPRACGCSGMEKYWAMIGCSMGRAPLAREDAGRRERRGGGHCRRLHTGSRSAGSGLQRPTSTMLSCTPRENPDARRASSPRCTREALASDASHPQYVRTSHHLDSPHHRRRQNSRRAR